MRIELSVVFMLFQLYYGFILAKLRISLDCKIYWTLDKVLKPFRCRNRGNGHALATKLRNVPARLRREKLRI